MATKGVLAGGGVGVALLGAAALGQHFLVSRQPRKLGTPQGGPISPLLSNVYLHAFDERMTEAGLRLVRYADDFVVCCASEARARQARDIAAIELSRLRLTLHPEKTRIVPCGDVLRFLGHEFDRDGAFLVCATPSAPVQEVARKGAAAAGRAAHSAAEAAKFGAENVRRNVQRAGTWFGNELAGRWRELGEGRK